MEQFPFCHFQHWRTVNLVIPDKNKVKTIYEVINTVFEHTLTAGYNIGLAERKLFIYQGLLGFQVIPIPRNRF